MEAQAAEKLELLPIKRLREAAINGDIPPLLQLVSEHPNILNLERCFLMQSPLHIALKLGHLDFAKQIVCGKPELAEEVDESQRSSTPLHISSKKGYLEMVKMLLQMSPGMCVARDRDGRNPAHIAAIRGHMDVLAELLQEMPQAARERTSFGGETVLHLCVKHRQLEALRFLIEELDVGDLLNFRDNDGNTVLHLAVAAKQPQTVRFLLNKKEMEKNAINTNGMTATDIYIQSTNDKKHGEIQQSLKDAKALPAKDILKAKPQAWLDKQRSALMVTASLIATMAFQVGANPSVSAWQQDDAKNVHLDSPFIVADKKPNGYKQLLASSTIGFVASLTVILLLISGLPSQRSFVVILMIIMWMAISATAYSYTVSVFFLSPGLLENNAALEQLTISLNVWLFLTIFLPLAHIICFFAKVIKKQECAANKFRRLSHPPPV